MKTEHNIIFKTVELFDANYQCLGLKIFSGDQEIATHCFDPKAQADVQHLEYSMISAVEKFSKPHTYPALEEQQRFAHQLMPSISDGYFIRSNTTEGSTKVPTHITAFVGSSYVINRDDFMLFYGRQKGQKLVLTKHDSNEYYTYAPESQADFIAHLEQLSPYSSYRGQNKDNYLLQLLTGLTDQQILEATQKFMTVKTEDPYLILHHIFLTLRKYTHDAWQARGSSTTASGYLGHELEVTSDSLLLAVLCSSDENTIHNLKLDTILPKILGTDWQEKAASMSLKSFNKKAPHFKSSSSHQLHETDTAINSDITEAEQDENDYIDPTEVRLEAHGYPIILSLYGDGHDGVVPYVFSKNYYLAQQAALDLAAQQHTTADLAHLIYGCLKHPEPDSAIVPLLKIDPEDIF